MPSSGNINARSLQYLQKILIKKNVYHLIQFLKEKRTRFPVQVEFKLGKHVMIILISLLNKAKLVILTMNFLNLVNLNILVINYLMKVFVIVVPSSITRFCFF